MWCTGKGSNTRELFPSADLKEIIADRIAERGTVGLDTWAEQNSYRLDIKDSVTALADNWQGGTHQFRHNFANEKF